MWRVGRLPDAVAKRQFDSMFSVALSARATANVVKELTCQVPMTMSFDGESEKRQRIE
jgi:hypothetical protein